MAALVLDVGSWFRAQRADAGGRGRGRARRRAGAAREPRQRQTPRRRQYVDKNGGGTATVTVLDASCLPNDTVARRAWSARDARASSPRSSASTPSTSAAKRERRARAALDRARWAAPIAVDETHPLLAVRAAAVLRRRDARSTWTRLVQAHSGVLNIDDSHGGDRPEDPRRLDHAAATTATCRSTGTSRDPGAKFNSSHDQRRARTRGSADELLFPVYRRRRAAAAPTSSTRSSAGSASS